MRIGNKKSPLRHKGSPSYLDHSMKSPEHAEWHKNNSTKEDSPEFIETKEEKEVKVKEEEKTFPWTSSRSSSPTQFLKSFEHVGKSMENYVYKEDLMLTGPTTIQEGNQFRRWINDNYPSYAKI